MKKISQQGRFLAPEQLNPLMQMGSVIDYNPSNATCVVRLDSGGLVRNMPILGTSGSEHGTDLAFTSNLRGSNVVVVNVRNQMYVLTTVPTQIKPKEKIASTGTEEGFAGEDKETYGAPKDIDYAGTRPKEYLSGDKILQADGGAEVGVLKEGLAVLKASPLSQFILGKLKDFGRLVTRIFQHYSDFGEVEHFHNNGKVGLSIKGGADFTGESAPGVALWTIQAWLGHNPANEKDRLYIRVNDKNNSEYVTLGFDTDGTAKIHTTKDILGTAERDIEFSADEDLQLLCAKNMSLIADGNGQYVAKGKLLIKSESGLILKGPSRTLKL